MVPERLEEIPYGMILRSSCKSASDSEILNDCRSTITSAQNVLSDDNKPDEKKKINLHIWYEKETLIWIKMSYNKLGRWEYRLKKQLFY